MTNQPLRWQLALLTTIIFGFGIAISFMLIPSSNAQYYLAHGVAFVTAAITVAWIMMSRRAIHLRRERRVWTLMTISVIAALLGHLYRIHYLFATDSQQIPSWSEFAFSVSYAMIWIALLTRSGKATPDRLSRLILIWDVLIILWASSIIAYHLALPGLTTFFSFSLAQKIVSIGYPVLGVITLIIITLMLFRSVPRFLHGPRGMLVLGVLLVFGSDIASSFAMMSHYVHLSLVLNAVGALGSLCYGVSSLWEASFYSQRTVRARVIDPFPSIYGLLVPAFLILSALCISLWSFLYSNQHGIPNGSLRTNILCLAVLIGLIIARQVLTFESHRRLYQNLQVLYAEMAQHAATDPLTNLANHRFFMERLQKEMRRATRYQRPLALIFCDLDFFKKINDTYGHIAGDHALRAMADCLRREVRDLDVVARYGGEEFVVLLPETTLEQAIVLAERLREGIAGLSVQNRQGEPIRLTMSCGVSAYPDTCDTVESLLATADHAMYQAKKNGRNRALPAPLRRLPSFGRRVGS